MLALVVVWGVNFPIVKLAFRELSPMAFNAVRFAGATAFLLLVLWWRGGATPVARSAWPGLIGLGLIGHALYQVTFINGLARTTAGNSSLILAMVPLFVAILSTVLGTDRVLPRTWVGILLAFAGLALLTTGRDGLRVSLATLAGDALTLVCSLAWAVYTVFSRPYLRTQSPLQWTALTMAVSAPVLVVVSLPEVVRTSWGAVTWPTWAALAYSTLLSIGIGYVVWYRSVQTLGGPRTAIYSNLIPIFALAASWVLLDERLGLLQAAGAVIVLVGVSLART